MSGDPNYVVITLALIGAIIVCGCITAGEDTKALDRISKNGTVTFVDLEGGFYGVVTDDEEQYLPTDLATEYQQDGLRVKFTADIMSDTATAQQWGTPIEITEIDTLGNATIVVTNGTVRYIDLEGGFYGIITDSGDRYLPFGLEEHYCIDEMQISFTGKIMHDTMTIQQWGTPIEVLDVSWACSRCDGDGDGGGGVGIANPAAVWCIEQGHVYEIRKDLNGNEYGVCILEDGTEIDEWEYYRKTH